MDVCRTALRHGTRHVECFSLSKKITASEYEASYAKLEGVNFHFNKKPVEITDKGVVFRDLNEAEDGTLTDIPDTEELYPSDSVIVSISQGPCTTITESEHDLKTNERGLFVTDELGHTSMPGVFASGDAVKRAHRSRGRSLQQKGGRGHARVHADPAARAARRVRQRTHGQVR